MNWKDLTPEQRRANARKAAATRAAKKSAPAATPVLDNPVESPPSLADLGLKVEEDDFRVDDVLSAEDIAEIRQAARDKVAAEKRASRKKLFMQLALDEARREAGDMPADEAERKANEEMVDIDIRMPRLRTANNRELPPEPIIIDGRVFTDGRSYHVNRAQAVYLMDRMGQARMHTAQVDGRSRTYYNQEVFMLMHQGGIAAGGAVGPSFDAIHRRPA